MRPLELFRFATVVALMVPVMASAQWSGNGNPVCTATGKQESIQMTANGLGGAAMVWHDYRAGATPHIYAQQIDNYGAVQWTPNGIPICTASGGQLNPQMTQDGFGYLVYTWQDYRSGTQTYAAITDRLGNVFTPADGIALSASTGTTTGASLTSNTTLGVAYEAWDENHTGLNPYDTIYGQAFNVNNYGFWPAGGLPICTFHSLKGGAAIASDEPGDGAIVAWSDYRGPASAVYAQHIDLGGNLKWTANGLAVCAVASAQGFPMIVNDGAGGAIVAWTDSRPGGGLTSIYAQRLDALGVKQWAEAGVLICTSSGGIEGPAMISDGAYGAILTWGDNRNYGTSGTDIYAQRINSGGSTLWTPNGALVTAAGSQQNSPKLAADGSGGAIITWQDIRSVPVSGPSDVYAQHMNGAGVAQWVADGLPVCTNVLNQLAPQIVADGAGGSLVAWEDHRFFSSSNPSDVFAQRIDNAAGIVGHPRATILSVTDVPGDQGGYVRIVWKPGDGEPVIEYAYNRLDGGQFAAGGTGTGAATYTDDVQTTGNGILNTYTVTVTTASTGLDSPPASGMSFDNLAPPAPRLQAAQLGPDVNLSWSVTASDIARYQINRDEVADFATSTQPSYVDRAPPIASHTYWVRGVDVNGNIGPYSRSVTVNMVTGVGDGPAAPKALTVLPNSPNPFSGSTLLHFGLPQAGIVHLDVYNVAGRRVASRETPPLAAGWRDLSFDGRDERGKLLPGGIYFYRVNAGGQTYSRRMVIGR